MLFLKLFLINFALILVEKLILHMMVLFLGNHVDMTVRFEPQLYQYFLLPSFLLFFFLFGNILVQNFPIFSDGKLLVVIEANDCIKIYILIGSVSSTSCFSCCLWNCFR